MFAKNLHPSGIPILIPFGAFLGWQLAAFLSEKEIDGEKIIYGTAGDNGSYANYKRILPNSIRWSKASVVKQRLSKKKQSFYLNNFRFTDKRIKNHFSLLPLGFAKHLEKRQLTLGWDEPITPYHLYA